MYHLQYWNPAAAEWRGCGVRTTDYSAALDALRRQQRECDFTVRFRILLPTDAPVSQSLAWCDTSY